MPSGTLGIAFTTSGVSQMHWNCPHAIWDTWDRFHTVWSIPDALGPPSCHLGHLESPSRCLECPQHVGTALMPSETLGFTFTLSIVFQTYWFLLYKTQMTVPLLDSQAKSYRGMSLTGLVHTLNHALHA
jgi:hypothetical protein